MWRTVLLIAYTPGFVWTSSSRAFSWHGHTETDHPAVQSCPQRHPSQD